MIDTNVLIRFLGDRVDAETPACKAFCNAMIDDKRRLWIAAPTIAEVSRHRGLPVPRFTGITVVPFDDRAANILGTQMPMAKIHAAKAQNGLSLTYLKYDAMILACALRVKTGTIVALDGDHVALAQGLSISVRRPESYYGASQTGAPQLALPLPAPVAPAAPAGLATATPEAPAAPAAIANAAAAMPPKPVLSPPVTVAPTTPVLPPLPTASSPIEGSPTGGSPAPTPSVASPLAEAASTGNSTTDAKE